jgi:hypothetical protein
MLCLQAKVMAQNGVSVIWDIEHTLKIKETQWRGVRLTLPAGLRMPDCPSRLPCGSAHSLRWERPGQMVLIAIFIGDSTQEAAREIEFRLMGLAIRPQLAKLEEPGDEAYQYVGDSHSWMMFRKGNVAVDVWVNTCRRPNKVYKYSAEALLCRAEAYRVAKRFAQEIAERIAAAT